MWTSLSAAISVALLATQAFAFTGLKPANYPAAKKHDHYGRAVAKAFGMDNTFKYSLHKRAVTKRDVPIERRMNDFAVEISNTPSSPQSAALDQDSTDYSYFCDVVLGTNPGLHVWLLMDTGSSVVWVMGEGCQTQACLDHDQFGANDSTTYQTGGGAFSIQYASGDVSGQAVTDQVSIAGLNVSMLFGVADQTADTFENYPIDGILGLARTPGPGPNFPTFLQVLSQNKLLKQNIFGMNLARAADNTNDGEINFGSIDTSKFQGNLNYINTVGDMSRWTLPVDGVMVNGQFTEVAGDRTAIIDTGTSYLYLPPADAAPIFAAIPGNTPVVNGSYIIPCDTSATVALVFNGIAYTMELKDYVGLPQGGGCVSHIFPQDVVGDGKTWLVGDTFLKNVYTVFDVDQSRIGFGAKGTVTTITSLVTTATPTVSAGSNPILSSMPTGSVSGSVSSGGSATGSIGSTSTAGALPIGGGSGSGPATNVSGTMVLPSTSKTASASGSTNTANTQGSGSTVAPFTLAQSITAFLFLMGLLVL